MPRKSQDEKLAEIKQMVVTSAGKASAAATIAAAAALSVEESVENNTLIRLLDTAQFNTEVLQRDKAKGAAKIQANIIAAAKTAEETAAAVETAAKTAKTAKDAADQCTAALIKIEQAKLRAAEKSEKAKLRAEEISDKAKLRAEEVAKDAKDAKEAAESAKEAAESAARSAETAKAVATKATQAVKKAGLIIVQLRAQADAENYDKATAAREAAELAAKLNNINTEQRRLLVEGLLRRVEDATTRAVSAVFDNPVAARELQEIRKSKAQQRETNVTAGPAEAVAEVPKLEVQENQLKRLPTVDTTNSPPVDPDKSPRAASTEDLPPVDQDKRHRATSTEEPHTLVKLPIIRQGIVNGNVSMGDQRFPS